MLNGFGSIHLAVVLGALLAAPVAGHADDYQQRVDRVLKQTPLIDGHNDLPWEIRERFNGDVAAFDLAADTSHLPIKQTKTAHRRDRLAIAGYRS